MTLDDKFKKAFPFSANYFSKLFETPERFPQSIVFEGSDPYAQCFFALELARILNCLEDGRKDCECLNCRWIRANTHPSINFVSQIHFKDSNDETATKISAKQARKIEKELREASDYHRFFIFFDAKKETLDKDSISSLEEFSPDGYNICPDGDWILRPLNQTTFHPSAPNILLKSVEEPPERTTFIFITKNRADLLSTIVSRSQIFKLPCAHKKTDFSYVRELLAPYPEINYETAFEISERIQNYIKENEISSINLIDDILGYFIQAGANDDDIKSLSKARYHLSSSMSERTVFDTLMLKIARSAE